MSSVDDLIKELNLSPGAPSSTATPQVLVGSRHSFDDSDDEDGEAPPLGVGGQRAVAPIPANSPAVGCHAGKATGGGGHDFDDDNSEEDDTSPTGTGRGHQLFLVPFPTPPSRTGKAVHRCPNACAVTNVSFHATAFPSIDSLMRVGKGLLGPSTPVRDAMKAKGAFHAYLPEVGNGCRSNGGDLGEVGGCPNIICIKCNYIVVRLQNAAWNDQGGRLDLYLTVRNFYPDWSRLAVSSPVGVSDENELVLLPSIDSAAYCCQCSWLTVHGPKETIRTSLIDLPPFKDKGGCCFATHCPSQPHDGASGKGDNRRYPLWMCAGHILE